MAKRYYPDHERIYTLWRALLLNRHSNKYNWFEWRVLENFTPADVHNAKGETDEEIITEIFEKWKQENGQ